MTSPSVGEVIYVSLTNKYEQNIVIFSEKARRILRYNKTISNELIIYPDRSECDSDLFLLGKLLAGYPVTTF